MTHSFINLQLFNVKFLFSEKHVFRKQKRMVVYGRGSLITDIKLTREDDGLLSSRHRYIFEVSYHMHEHTKMQIPKKKYQTKMVCTFWGTWSASALRYFSVDHFSSYHTKIYGKQQERRAMGPEILVCLIKLVRLCGHSLHGVFPFTSWPVEVFGRI